MQTFTVCYRIKQNYFKIIEKAFTFSQPRQCHCPVVLFFFYTFALLLVSRLCSNRNISDVTWKHPLWNPNWRQIFSARSGFSNFCFPRQRALTHRWKVRWLCKRVSEKNQVLEGFELVEIFSQVDAMLVMCLRASFWGRWDKYLKRFVAKFS